MTPLKLEPGLTAELLVNHTVSSSANDRVQAMLALAVSMEV